MLALSCKQQAEVRIAAKVVQSSIGNLRKRGAQTREAKARIAIIAGLFNSLQMSEQNVAALALQPTGNAGTLTERIDEMLEDAYLLEASAIRRFLGIDSNVAAAKRDLRLLARAIAQRPWARGLLKETTSKLSLGPAARRALDAIESTLGAEASGVGGFILVVNPKPIGSGPGKVHLLPGRSYTGADWGTIIPNPKDRVEL